MKKALLILLALSIVGAAAFADAKWGGFVSAGLKANVSTVGSTSTDSLYSYDWFQGLPWIGVGAVTFTGADPNMGFDTRIVTVSSAYSTVDQAVAWMKFLDGMVKVNLGRMSSNGEDFETAENMWGQHAWEVGPQVSVYVTPLEGLKVGYQLPLAEVAGTSIADNLYNSRVGASYTMKDVFAVTGAYVMNKDSTLSNAYFGVSINAIPKLGLWFEGLLVNIGSNLPTVAAPGNVGGETDLYLEANYPVMDTLLVGVAATYDIVNNSAQKSGWVAEPYVVYTVMENFKLTGAFDIGTVNWGWYGLQNGGAALAGDALQWDVWVRASLMSPLGELRIQATYGCPDTVASPAQSFFQVKAGVKWGF